MRATVMDVPLLVKLGCDRAVIMGAAQQTSKRKLVLAVFRLVAASECLLHALEQIRRYQWCMSALVLDTSGAFQEIRRA